MNVPCNANMQIFLPTQIYSSEYEYLIHPDFHFKYIASYLTKSYLSLLFSHIWMSISYFFPISFYSELFCSFVLYSLGVCFYSTSIYRFLKQRAVMARVSFASLL